MYFIILRKCVSYFFSCTIDQKVNAVLKALSGSCFIAVTVEFTRQTPTTLRLPLLPPLPPMALEPW